MGNDVSSETTGADFGVWSVDHHTERVRWVVEWQTEAQEGKFGVDVAGGGAQVSGAVQRKTPTLTPLPHLCSYKVSMLTGQGRRGAGGLS